LQTIFGVTIAKIGPNSRLKNLVSIQKTKDVTKDKEKPTKQNKFTDKDKTVVIIIS
jgi:hypothetical protein